MSDNAFKAETKSPDEIQKVCELCTRRTESIHPTPTKMVVSWSGIIPGGYMSMCKICAEKAPNPLQARYEGQ